MTPTDEKPEESPPASTPFERVLREFRRLQEDGVVPSPQPEPPNEVKVNPTGAVLDV